MMLAPASPAAGDEAEELRLLHGASAGFGPLLHLLPVGPAPGVRNVSGWALEMSYGARHDGHGVEADVGARGVFAQSTDEGVAFEAFAGIAYAPELGNRWHPQIGLELGISTVLHFSIGEDTAAPESALHVLAEAPLGYLGTTLSPARFRWQRWDVDTMALFIGSSIPDPGRAVRLQISLVRVGTTF